MAFNSYTALEARVSEACDVIHDGWYTNCAHAANAYEVPIRRLKKQRTGSTSKSTRIPTNKALTEEQEGAVRDCTDRLDKIDVCLPTDGYGSCRLPYLFRKSHGWSPIVNAIC